MKNRKSSTEESSARLSSVRDSCTGRQSTATAVAKAAYALDRPQIDSSNFSLPLSLPLSVSPSLHFVIIQQDYAKISTPPAELQSVVVALHEVGQMQIVAKSFTQRINAQ